MREEIILDRDNTTKDVKIPLLALKNYVISVMEFGEYNNMFAARGIHKISVYNERGVFYIVIDVTMTMPSVYATDDNVDANTPLQAIFDHVALHMNYMKK